MNYPKHRVSKNVSVKLAPQIGVIGCEYRHILKAFGQPTFCTDYGDEFDGIEKCAWTIEFEGGQTVQISDVRPFGSNDLDYKQVKEWRVNSQSSETYEWIREKIIDANPNP